MSQIRPKILLRYGRINQPVRIPLYDLLVDPGASTILTSDTASGSSTLTVKNITGFAINQVILIGEPGNEGSEIIKTHTATAPTGSTITLVSNTIFPHSSSTPVRVIRYDSVEIYTSPTVGGTKTLVTTQSLSADSKTTDYVDSSSSGYYYARFKNTIGTATYSDYSDPAPVGGYTQLSARSLIDNALGMINKETSSVLSDEYGFQQINNCQMEVLREYKRWSFMEVFNANIGESSVGVWKIALPTDCDDQFTNKSIWNFRLGKEDNMVWVDKEKWNDITTQIATSTLSLAINIGDSTITLTDSSDFSDGGTVYITDHSYQFTANDRTTGVLTLSAVSTTANSLGDTVFQGASFGNPVFFTIFPGYIYFYPVCGTDYDQRNLYLDYYKKITTITSDSDETVIVDPTLVQYYLAWKFLLRLNSGTSDENSNSFLNLYIARRSTLKQKESMGRTFYFKPTLPRDNSGNIRNFGIKDN